MRERSDLMNELRRINLSTYCVSLYSELGYLLDESCHFISGDSTVAILVELFEHLIEIFVADFTTCTLHFGESCGHELPSLGFVESIALVSVVLFPNLLDASCDNGVNVYHFQCKRRNNYNQTPG